MDHGGEEVKMSAGQDTIISSYQELIQSANVNTLRELIKITSNALHDLENLRPPPPCNEDVEKMFKFIPNILNSVSLDVSTSLPAIDNSLIQDQQQFIIDLQSELNTLGLDKGKGNSVKNAWITADSVNTNLPTATPMSKYKCISKLCDIINNHEETVGSMNGCLVNYYPTGISRSKPHSDNESYNDQSASICTFSLGQTREFGIYSNDHHNPALLKSYMLCEKSLFVMKPGSQACTKHMIHSSSSESGVRWSISFRRLIDTKVKGEWPFTSSHGHKNLLNATLQTSHENLLNESAQTTIILGTSITHRLQPHKLAGKYGNIKWC